MIPDVYIRKIFKKIHGRCFNCSEKDHISVKKIAHAKNGLKDIKLALVLQIETISL